MSTSDFKSNLGEWVNSARYWFGTAVFFVDEMLPAWRAVEMVNNILSLAPSEMWGEIPINLTEAKIREFGDHWMIMKEFADSIHYEAEELIDVPFIQSLNGVLSDVYGLDPKDIKVNKKFLGFIPYAGDNLWELISDVINDETLKNDLLDKFEELDSDEISDEFQQIIVNANYWAGEFDKAEKIRNLQQDFLDQYEENWLNMTPEERKKVLNEYAVKVGRCYDDPKRWRIPKKIVSGLEVDSEDDGYGYTYSRSPTNNRIYVSGAFMDSDNSELLSYNLQKALNTVNHESRHQYQGEAAYLNPQRYNLPSNIKDEWNQAFDGYKDPGYDYWRSPIEVDARAIAALASA